MDNENKKGGFSQLSDLASDINNPDDVTGSESPSSSPPSTKPSPSQSGFEKNNKRPSVPVDVEPFEKPRGGGSSGWRWIFGLIAVVFLIWLANNNGHKTSESSYNQPRPSQTRSLSKDNSVSITFHNTNNGSEVRYEEPPIGKENVLSVHQICWCIRERIRIETMRSLINTPEGIISFNNIVDDYNQRCGSYRYRSSSLEQAQREVTAKKRDIIASAIKDAQKLCQSNPTSYRGSALSEDSGNPKKNSRQNLVREAQLLLTALGYDPGPIDGKYGKQTASAVEFFQRNMGLPKSNRIDKDLVRNLEKAVEKK